jgi:murein DD-endopeptidase MepM/ murein hydrolase activator NlpD
MTIMSVVMLGVLVAGVYLYIFTDAGASFPFSCSLPSPPQPKEPAQSCIIPTEAQRENASPGPSGSQQIVDVAGEGDTLFSVLSANLPDEETAKDITLNLAAVMQAGLNEPFDGLTPLKQGTRYNIVLDKEGRLLQATIEFDPANVFHASLEGETIRCWKEDVVLDFKVEALCFLVRGTLTESVMNIGEGIDLAMKLTDVFRWDIDFQSEARRGDVCKVLFQRRYADDRPSGYGDILCAVYEGKKTGKKTAVLFNKRYYDQYGTELKKDFLRSPLSVLRVTSNYGKRFHPILRTWRHHLGVDYGAAKGTPVWTVASGVVTFSGWQGDYGNYVCIRHDGGYESRYGHLSRIFVQKGQRVKQRQRLGLVGMTGLASGPHLHYEWLEKGKHRNPLNVKMVQSLRTVHPELKSRFVTVSQERLTQLGNFTVQGPMPPMNLAARQ